MKPAEHQGSQPPRSREAADRARPKDQLEKSFQIRALLLAGLSPGEVAKKVGVSSLFVRDIGKKLKDHDIKAKIFKRLLDLFAENLGETYKQPMRELGEIENILSKWNADAVERLTADLKSGKLGKIYEQASGSTSAVIVPNPSGWVPTAQLPPDVATAVRAAGAIRQRTRRSKLSEAEKAEERAKAAARMRAKRSRTPEP